MELPQRPAGSPAKTPSSLGGATSFSPIPRGASGPCWQGAQRQRNMSVLGWLACAHTGSNGSENAGLYFECMEPQVICTIVNTIWVCVRVKCELARTEALVNRV